MTAPVRVARCRYLDRHQNRCTGEAVEEGAEIELCTKHLAYAWAMIRRRAVVLT